MKKNKVVPFSHEKGSESKQKIKKKKMNKTSNSMQKINNNNELFFEGMTFGYVQEPLIELAKYTGVLIKQKPDLVEAKTGYETPNRYHVFGQYGDNFYYLFNCRERSGCCMRNCCPSSSRAFNMEISHISSPGKRASDCIFAVAYKPFSCQCFCCFCCNSELVLTLCGNQQIKVGVVKHLLTVCDPEFEIYDETNQLKYIVTANGCQCGLICANCCIGKCYEVFFDILDPIDNKVIGNVKRRIPEGDEVITDADSYEIVFPVTSNATDKLLILALGLMIDYQYFESTKISKKRQRKAKGITIV
jgi:hypothetical protein